MSHLTIFFLRKKKWFTPNQSKCELTFNIDAATEAENVYHTISTALPGINITQPECLTLLGSPLHTAGLRNAIGSARTTIRRLCTRLRRLDRHTAVFFLSKYVSAPRVQYLLRSSPAYLEPGRARPHRQHCPPHASGGVQRGHH